MQGFKEFILRGNLVELAVAFIMATAFGAVVTAFTDMLMGFIGKVGGQPDFSALTLADVNIGLFINSVITFIIIAAVVYFFVVTPYEKARDKYFPAEEEGPADDIVLLGEIRNLLAQRGGQV